MKFYTKYKRKFLFGIPAFALFLSAYALFAETVFLRDGSQRFGRIERETGSHVYLREPNGPNLRQYPRRQILEIQYAGFSVPEVAPGFVKAPVGASAGGRGLRFTFTASQVFLPQAVSGGMELNQGVSAVNIALDWKTAGIWSRFSSWWRVDLGLYNHFKQPSGSGVMAYESVPLQQSEDGAGLNMLIKREQSRAETGIGNFSAQGVTLGLGPVWSFRPWTRHSGELFISPLLGVAGTGYVIHFKAFGLFDGSEKSPFVGRGYTSLSMGYALPFEKVDFIMQGRADSIYGPGGAPFIKLGISVGLRLRI